jgi:Cdc6-like AAA superfamily ATPase
VTWNESAFETLVLDRDKKKLIDALVTSQSQSAGSSDFVDIVKGKGQGLTILLHGAPGTGKTLTVERLVHTAVSKNEQEITVQHF